MARQAGLEKTGTNAIRWKVVSSLRGEILCQSKHLYQANTSFTNLITNLSLVAT